MLNTKTSIGKKHYSVLNRQAEAVSIRLPERKFLTGGPNQSCARTDACLCSSSACESPDTSATTSRENSS